jgi:urease accessory protein
VRIESAATPESQAIKSGPWQAKLRLGFSRALDNTILSERTHSGPLRVQKALYPEGKEICHAIIVHPPGGVVGGDELDIDINVGTDAHAVITTPGAAKWYKANGKRSKQTVRIHVEANASMEWLPQESIFFDAADVQLSQDIHLDTDARYIACDILCFGRAASGETFKEGKISQRTSIWRAGRLLWFEQGAMIAGSAAMASALGLGGNSVCATLIAIGKAVPNAVIDALRAEATLALEGDARFGVTQMKGVLVVRYLGNASEMARTLMLLAWRHLRPTVVAREAINLRIWNT